MNTTMRKSLTDREVSKAINDGDPIFSAGCVGYRWGVFCPVYYRHAIEAQEHADKLLANGEAISVYVYQVGGTAGLGGKRMHHSLTRFEEHAPYCALHADHLDACRDDLG